MPERKPQTRFVPLRIRFRSFLEPSQKDYEPAQPTNGVQPNGVATTMQSNGNGHSLTQNGVANGMQPNGVGYSSMPNKTANGMQPNGVTHVVSSNGVALHAECEEQRLACILEEQKRTRQVKELLRLGNLLRADLSLDEVLQHIAASTASCTGFRVLVMNLINEKMGYIMGVAFAGLSEEDQDTMRNAHDPAEKITRLMRPEYRIGQSYFISHEHTEAFEGSTVVMVKSPDGWKPGDWHPADALLVPMFSPREQKMLGFLSLDDPEDGKVPTLESIEVAELFASQAAIAIDNARLFQEREEEHAALEQGVALLREDLERLRAGDMHTHIRSSHEKLQPIADTLNVMIEEINGILKDMQMVAHAVDDHTRNVQRSSESLVRDTIQQERQVHQISQVINDIASMMHSVSERAAILSKTAVDAVDVTVEAQGAVDRAVEGMGMVREATMQSARTMKSLSESGQEINETVLDINNLTTRMHLLSLNAAIEAARAGEQGQSFALIAKEIRTLAMLCSEAARKIDTYIRTVQHETIAVSQSVEQGTQKVVMQTELVTQAGVALEAISIVTEQLTNLIQGICETAENQSQGSQLVVSAVSEILHMTGDITRHMREMQHSMAHLVELTNSLRSRMAVFQL
ncbi:MAG TPA: methyl-accepting chemotaxis protein [Ktedonosporobacter sp.]|jgi:methyl-accepting chemotaxis protein|nr:methyl-accepting chemotaxis protein [Ktedonosporobacter sp.]